ncbi:molecular chaperone SurA [Nitrosomonas sp. HPC101]|uniref:peptidylprolyl isomerase n=1 Tax=Nitrosomonas sp. HPC101 TaxID=1658667 RepID=UPI00136857AC|nr:peptidylprolyl isomerase [Nitrosomonas sp. HPC101]MXS85483.1 molecular chaperone SurA [Nitrosomonas sp. HPC101]
MIRLSRFIQSEPGKFALIGIFFSAMWAISVSAQDFHPEIKPLDRIVAVVDEEVITQQELNELLQKTVQQLQKQNTQLPNMDVLEKQLLERLIIKRIQLQRAKEVGLTVSDNDLDQTLRRIVQDNQLTMNEFRQILLQEGTSLNVFREEIRDEILMTRLKEQEINSRVNVTESEVDNFLENQANSPAANEEYRIAHILVHISEQMDEAQIEARHQQAEAAYEELQQGVSFAQVSAEYSDAADALQGGELGWRPLGQLGSPFSELLLQMQPGEITPVIRSPIGFHILKLFERRQQENSVTIIEQTHAQHILIKVSEIISEEDARQLIDQVMERIHNGADFMEMAKAHSEDSSASSGGDLGWISPGDTVPEFEQAMNTLLPGQVSQPVRTPFGWHLIKVIERRSQDVSEQKQRETARKTIHARKADAVAQEWLQQIRDQAYVEYKVEGS